MRVGLISDTHGKLRDAVFDALDGVDRIVHAGDIGPYELLVELEAIAPVTAVFGNTDGFQIRDRVEEIAEVDAAGLTVAVVHGHQLGSPAPAALRTMLPHADVIVYGHTHRPLVDRNGSLVINPGSAGAARFGLAPSVAVLTVAGSAAEVQIIDLP